MKKPISDQVTFRLHETFVQQLDEAAQQQEMSRGQYARKLLIDALQNTDQVKTQLTLEEITSQLQRSREDLASVAKVLLVMVGNCDQEEANEWVERELLDQ